MIGVVFGGPDVTVTGSTIADPDPERCPGRGRIADRPEDATTIEPATDESTGRSRRRVSNLPPRNVRTPQGRVVVNGNPG